MWSGARERGGERQGNSNFLKANLGKVEVKKAWAAECFRQPAPEAKDVRLCLSVCASLCGYGVCGGRKGS